SVPESATEQRFPLLRELVTLALACRSPRMLALDPAWLSHVRTLFPLFAAFPFRGVRTFVFSSLDCQKVSAKLGGIMHEIHTGERLPAGVHYARRRGGRPPSSTGQPTADTAV